jgi:hypothetical protein
MRRADYLDGLHRAYLGEVAGAALARSFAERPLNPTERAMCGLIERLETATARIMAPLLSSPPGDGEIDQAALRGKAAANGLDGWTGLVGHTAYGLDRDIGDFAALRDAAPSPHRPSLELLVAHEIALRDFGQAVLAGRPDPSGPLRAAIAAAERHLTAHG